MGVLRNLEEKLEHLVEGLFSRTFKSRVQPVELARKLAKEMEANKTVSISRTYVPNEYTVFLSPEDRRQVESYERALSQELASYLLEYARREGLTLLTRPAVSFESDERLHLGEFGIQARLVKPPTEDDEHVEQGEVGRTMVYNSLRDADEASRADEPPQPRPVRRALLTASGKRFPFDAASIVVGRSRECDVVLQDSAISRKHAQITRQGEHWYITDMESVNGVHVNGRRVDSTRLVPGDEVTLGTTKIIFDLE